jgi:hypothetical protein
VPAAQAASYAVPVSSAAPYAYAYPAGYGGGAEAAPSGGARTAADAAGPVLVPVRAAASVAPQQPAPVYYAVMSPTHSSGY